MGRYVLHRFWDVTVSFRARDGGNHSECGGHYSMESCGTAEAAVAVAKARHDVSEPLTGINVQLRDQEIWERDPDDAEKRTADEKRLMEKP